MFYQLVIQILMLSKPKIKLITSLKMGKFRKQHGLFVAEGTTNVVDFIKAGVVVNDLFATTKWLAINKANIPELSVTEASEKELQKITFLKNS